MWRPSLEHCAGYRTKLITTTNLVFAVVKGMSVRVSNNYHTGSLLPHSNVRSYNALRAGVAITLYALSNRSICQRIKLDYDRFTIVLRYFKGFNNQ